MNFNENSNNGWISKKYNKKKSSFTYYGFWKEGKKTRSISLKTNKKKTAITKFNIFRAKNFDTQKEYLTIEDGCNLYIDFKTNILKQKTITNYKTYYEKLISHFHNNNIIYLHEISINHLNHYIKSRTDSDNASGKTINEEIGFLQYVFKYLYEINYINKIHIRRFPKIEKPRAKKPDRLGSYTEVDIKRTLHYLKEHNSLFHDYFAFLACTGARKSEMLTLKKQDIDFHNSTISIRNLKTETNSKNAFRKMEIHEYLIPLLSKRCKHINNSDTVFHEAKSKSPNWLLRKMIEVCLILEIPYKRIHGLRHSFVTNLILNNVPLLTIMKLTGHTSMKTLQKYVDLSGQTSKGIINKLQYNTIGGKNNNRKEF